MNAHPWVILWLFSVMVGLPLAMASAAALSSLAATDATELLTRLRKLLLSGNRPAAERLVARADDALLRLARAALSARLPVGVDTSPSLRTKPDPTVVRALLDDAMADERRAIDTWWYLGLLGAIPPSVLVWPTLAEPLVHRTIVLGVTLCTVLSALYATRKRFEALSGLSALCDGLSGFVRSELEDDPED